MQLLRPVKAERANRQHRHWVSAGGSALLLGAALFSVAFTGDDHNFVLYGQVPPSANTAVRVTTQDVNAAAAQVKANLHNMQTEKAGSIRGSVPTDEAEAEAIVGNMNKYVRTMGDPFLSVTGSHSDHGKEADAIIDFANKDNMDVTGAAGAKIYEVASDPHAPASAWLRGSVPNYNAESTYITSGVAGNYEKSLENAETMSVVGGKVPPRVVAYEIVDAAYRDPTSPDCTGSVDANGIHGVGLGTPPCIGIVKFKRPKNIHGSPGPLSKIFVNVSLDLTPNGYGAPSCDKSTESKVRHALADAAGVSSADVVFPSDETFDVSAVAPGITAGPPIPLTAGWKLKVWNFTDAGSGELPEVDLGTGTVNMPDPPIIEKEVTNMKYDDQIWEGLGAPADNFLAVLTGFLDLKEAGNYDFWTTSDDGSKLWIDNVLVVDNGGLHGPVKRMGTVNLSPGFHSIVVEFFEAGGGAFLEISWRGSDTGGAEQPAVVFQKPDTAAKSLRQPSLKIITKEVHKGSVTKNAAHANILRMSKAQARQVGLQDEVSKVQRQLAHLERVEHKSTNLAAAEAKAFQGDSLFERKLAAAALELQLSLNKREAMQRELKASEHRDGYNGRRLLSLNSPLETLDGTELYRKPVSAGLTCEYSAYILVPKADSFDANVNTLKQTSNKLVQAGFMPLLSISTTLEDAPQLRQDA